MNKKIRPRKTPRTKPATKIARFTEADRAELVAKVAAKAGAPTIPTRPVSAWDPQGDGNANADAPLDVIVEALFEDFRGEYADRRATSFLSKILRSIGDDAELASVASTQADLDHSQTIARVLARIESRSRMAIEVARRIERGEVRP